MNAWVFAVTLFVTILAFEFLLFRYVGRDNPAAGPERAEPTGPAPGTDGVANVAGTDHAGERVGDAVDKGPAGAGAPPSPGSSAVTGGPDDGHAKACPACGQPNVDAAMVQFCWHCMARLR